MANYWLEIIDLEDTANDLADYIMEKARGAKLSDPQKFLDSTVRSYYAANVKAQKYEHRIHIKADIAKGPNNSGYWITKVVVMCQ